MKIINLIKIIIGGGSIAISIVALKKGIQDMHKSEIEYNKSVAKLYENLTLVTKNILDSEEKNISKETYKKLTEDSYIILFNLRTIMETNNYKVSESMLNLIEKDLDDYINNARNAVKKIKD